MAALRCFSENSFDKAYHHFLSLSITSAMLPPPNLLHCFSKILDSWEDCDPKWVDAVFSELCSVSVDNCTYRMLFNKAETRDEKRDYSPKVKSIMKSCSFGALDLLVCLFNYFVVLIWIVSHTAVFVERRGEVGVGLLMKLNVSLSLQRLKYHKKFVFFI